MIRSAKLSSPTPRPTPTWQFAARFRRAGFGWKGSRLAAQCIRAALSEIRTVARHDPILAAEGLARLIEKLSPALPARRQLAAVSFLYDFLSNRNAGHLLYQ